MKKISVAEADLLYDILLGGYDSLLFSELSEGRGLCYDLSGSVERFANIGAFSFSFEVSPSKLEEALLATKEVLRTLKSEPLPPERCMKAGYVDNALMLFDDSRELNFTFAYDSHLLGLGYSSLSDRRQAYERITPEALCKSAEALFCPENLTFTAKADKKHTVEGRIKEILRGI